MKLLGKIAVAAIAAATSLLAVGSAKADTFDLFSFTTSATFVGVGGDTGGSSLTSGTSPNTASLTYIPGTTFTAYYDETKGNISSSNVSDVVINAVTLGQYQLNGSPTTPVTFNPLDSTTLTVSSTPGGNYSITSDVTATVGSFGLTSGLGLTFGAWNPNPVTQGFFPPGTIITTIAGGTGVTPADSGVKVILEFPGSGGNPTPLPKTAYGAAGLLGLMLVSKRRGVKIA